MQTKILSWSGILFVAWAMTGMAASDLLINTGTTNNPTSLTTGTYNRVYIGYTSAVPHVEGHGLLTNGTVWATNGASANYVGYYGTGSLHITDGGALTTDYSFIVGEKAGSKGTLLIDGIQGNAGTANVKYLVVGRGCTGSLTVAGYGALTVSPAMYIGHSGGGIGTLFLEDNGSFTFNAVSKAAYIPYSSATGRVYQTGGTYTDTNVYRFYLGYYDGSLGEYHISGGSLFIGGPGPIYIGGGTAIGQTSLGRGLFHVNGSGATNIVFRSNVGLSVYSNGVMKFTVDTGGVSKIVVTTGNYYMNFWANSRLDMEMTRAAAVLYGCYPTNDPRRDFEIIAGDTHVHPTYELLTLLDEDTDDWYLYDSGNLGQRTNIVVRYLRHIVRGTIFMGR